MMRLPQRANGVIDALEINSTPFHHNMEGICKFASKFLELFAGGERVGMEFEQQII